MPKMAIFVCNQATEQLNEVHKIHLRWRQMGKNIDNGFQRMPRRTGNATLWDNTAGVLVPTVN